MNKLSKLKGVKALSNKEQKSIHGGFMPPLEPTFCICIVIDSRGFFGLAEADCFSPCPDGSNPIHV